MLELESRIPRKCSRLVHTLIQKKYHMIWTYKDVYRVDDHNRLEKTFFLINFIVFLLYTLITNINRT